MDYGTSLKQRLLNVLLLISNVEHPLAQGFDLRAGSVSVTVPQGTTPGDDYCIVRE